MLLCNQSTLYVKLSSFLKKILIFKKELENKENKQETSSLK